MKNQKLLLVVLGVVFLGMVIFVGVISMIGIFFARGTSSDTNRGDNQQVISSPTREEPTILPTPVRRVENCFIVAKDQLPSNWPDDFPYYVNSVVHSVLCGDEDDNISVRLWTSDAPEVVASFIEKKAREDKWTFTSFVENDKYETYSYYKMLNAQKKHEKFSREMIIDLRVGLRDVTGGKTEIIYRERISSY